MNFGSIAVCGVLLAMALLSGCASLTATEREQLAFRGEGANPCLFGGVTAEADLHCQEVGQGLYGALLNINAQVIQNLDGAAAANSCQLHVARIREALWPRSDLEVRSVFSCPFGQDDCHVSALVMAQGGQVYVLDNGTLLRPGLYPGSVGSFGEYHAAVSGEYWFHPPVVPETKKPSAPARMLAQAEVPQASAGSGGSQALMRRR